MNSRTDDGEGVVKSGRIPHRLRHEAKTPDAVFISPLVSAWAAGMRVARGRMLIFVGIPVLVGVLLTVIVFFDVRQSNRHQVEMEFNRRAGIMATDLKREIDANIDVVLAIVSLFGTGQEISREDFRAFVEPILRRHRDLKGVSWNRLLREAERSALEEAVQREGYASFRISQQDGQGGLMPAQPDDEHVAVYYIEPLEGNEEALGYDLASDPVRRSALHRARDRGEVVATSPIALVQEPHDQSGFLFFAPIYRPGAEIGTEDQRRRSLSSYVSGVFRAELMVETALQSFAEEHIVYEIVDRTDPADPRPLCASTSSTEHAPHLKELRSFVEFEIAGRRWAVEFTPGPGYRSAESSNKPWAVLATGLLFTCLLAGFLLAVAGRSSELQKEIAERKEVEAALRASEERFRTVFEASAIGITISDPEGRFLEVNDYIAERLGYSRDALCGRSFLDLLHPENHARAERRSDDPSEEIPAALDHVERLLTSDGKPLWAIARHVTIRDENGVTQYIVGLIEDVTLRRRLEAEILKSQKLESAGLLAGGIAHDFNNLLTVINGSASLARMQQGLDPKVSGYLEQIETAVSRATGLTHQLLTFSKGGAPILETQDLSGLIREAATFVRGGATVDVSFDLPDDLWPALADRGQIGQVMGNLVVNACQAMAEGGTVRVGARNVEISPDDGLVLTAGRYVEISIADGGVGILPENRQKVFDPYFTTKPGGSGLGLATAYSIIQKHRGAITLDSVPGVGTTFRVYLPASTQAASAPTIAGKIPVRGGGGRILIMDDEELIRVLAGRVATRLGYEVHLASDGEEAVQRYREALDAGAPFDAVILDLTVPGGVGGLAALRQLLEIDPEVRAIVSSGYSDDPVMSRYREYGFKGVVAKPYSMSEFGHALQTITEGATAMECSEAPEEDRDRAT